MGQKKQNLCTLSDYESLKNSEIVDILFKHLSLIPNKFIERNNFRKCFQKENESNNTRGLT